MPKRHLSMHAVEAEQSTGAPRQKRGLFRRLTSMWAGKAASPISEPVGGRSSVTQAMRTRRMSVEAKLDDIAANFAHKAAIDGQATSAPTTGPNPNSLPPFHIVGPGKGKKHLGTLILLHGFTCSGHQLAGELLPPLRARLGAREAAVARHRELRLEGPQRHLA